MSDITLFAELENCDTLTDGERAEINAMKRKILEKYIEDHHKYAISEVIKKGYHGYKTRVDSSHHLSAKTLDQLYEKLYLYYSGHAIMVRASIGSILTDVLNWQYTEDQIKTKKRQILIYNSMIKGSVIDKKQLKDITAHDLATFFKSFNNHITSTQYGNLKSLLNVVFDYASTELSLFPYNPCRALKVKMVFVPEGKIGQKAYSRTEAEKIVRYLYNSTNAYDEALCFAFYTGLRFSEFSDLRWTDVDGDVISITHANTESGNIKTGQKGSGEIALSQEAQALIERIRAERPSSDLVFPNKSGHVMQNNHLNERLKEVCEALDIPYRSSHKIRAYAITYKATTCGILSAQKMARHTDPSMTNRYINKSVTDKDRLDSSVLNFGILPIPPKEKVL